jgi:acetyl-CoA C-acetyltransferase
MTNVVIVAAGRTAVGSFNGSFAATPAHDLGAAVIEAVVARAGIDKAEVEETILGQVLTAGQGQNPARQAHIKAGLAKEASAWSLNQVCGSGLRAVALGAQHVQLGDARIIVAGGQESMSLSPHVAHLRAGQKMGDLNFIDSMIKDGLWDAFNGYHMGQTAENVANQLADFPRHAGRIRPGQPEQGRSGAKGRQVQGRDHRLHGQDPQGRHGGRSGRIHPPRRHAGIDAEAAPGLHQGRLGHGGNASGLNDGAAAVVLMTAEEAAKRGLTPLARIASYATAGLDPSIMGVGPIHASRKALTKAGWKVGDLDLVEANEAFAAQACAVNKDMGWDPAIVNVNGGAIAIGHPIGASGARILNTLLFEMGRSGAKKGLATLCIGGGMGVAMCLERA